MHNRSVNMGMRRALCAAVLLGMQVFFAASALAQNALFVSREQPLAVLPEQPQGLSVVDSDLYLNASGVLMKTVFLNNEIVGFVADTSFVKFDENISYVVRHPSTGDLYFTRLDRKGRSCLFFSHFDGKRAKTKRVKMDDIEVVHPTFSADGRVMVFSSSERRRSYGGYDLWYSRLHEGEWTEPVNMGSRVNSQGDDVTPSIVGDYLFFSSNGRNESKNNHNIFATRLIAHQVTGDTVGMLQIGRSRVQQLPQGINSAVSDCYDFVVDTVGHCCWWVNASSGIRCYRGTLDAVTLWGYTNDARMQPLSGVRVTVRDGDDAIAMAVSGADGFYRLTLPAGHTYNMEYSLSHRFTHRFALTTESDDSGNLIGEARHDVVLDSLPVGRQFLYTDLFGPDAVVDLSAHGTEVLAPLVTFLTDNPSLKADLTLYCDITTDAEFNALLSEQRLKVLEEYLKGLMPEGSVLRMHNGCGGRGGCSDATGGSRLTILLK